MIAVATWNVLHRVHADNYAGDTVERWPREADRIASVAAAIAQLPERVIALQEVSGDQVESLREALPDRTVHVLRYPRVPTPRRLPDPLRDRSENLVIVSDGSSKVVAAENFANDRGNGLLAVEFEDLLVVATHVSGDERRESQFVRLAEVVADRRAVLLGDFNVDRGTVAAALGGDFEVAEFPADSIPTRPRTSGTKSQFIDHVAGRGVTVRDLVVEDVAGVSDHNLVRAVVG